VYKRGRIELYAVEKVAACEALDTVNTIDHMIWVIAFGFFVFYGVRGGGMSRTKKIKFQAIHQTGWRIQRQS
jgi:hypothetical protein